MESKADRDARLGAALRANLRRRKAQARGQADADGQTAIDTDQRPAAARFADPSDLDRPAYQPDDGDR